jgi:hypothetical protein
MTNKDNCGSCGHVCQQNHANNQCINGSCVPSCDLGWANCDGNNDNGCDRSIGAQQNTCSTASYQGSWCGEESCGIFCLFGGSWENAFGTSGSNSVWYRANAEQCSSWCDSTVRHRVKLTVPQGVTYKLCIWWNCSSLYGCTDVSGSSTTMEVSKYDSDFTYYIEVRYVSGATCGNWNLSVDWRNCL